MEADNTLKLQLVEAVKQNVITTCVPETEEAQKAAAEKACGICSRSLGYMQRTLAPLHLLTMAINGHCPVEFPAATPHDKSKQQSSP